MSPSFIIVLAVLTIFWTAYAVIILYYTVGWYRLEYYVPEKDQALQTKCSVIVPARNEGRNIGHLLQDLDAQSLPRDLYEVIVVDDHSTDDTAAVVTQFSAAHPGLRLKLLPLLSDQQTTAFKKKAIEEAIRSSAGDLIITTDADCRVGTGWLETIAGLHHASGAKMIVGPVSFHQEKTFFERMQTLEFLSLIGITAGAVRMGTPVMCNGANLAYERSAFRAAGGFGGSRFSSGDDVFLMFRIRRLFGARSIRFLKNREALVHTHAKRGLGDFIQQRTRWASKNKGYSAGILAVSFTVYMVNLILLAAMASLVAEPAWWPAVAALVALKYVIDLPILAGIGKFAGRPGMILYSIPLIVVYPVYIVLVGALGMLGNYRWKGRKVKN